jgi:cell wall-associated NlpC family hydrolase
VQQALMACGRAAPRWSDGQAVMGDPIARTEAGRGDLVIWLRPEAGAGAWTGHSAILLDAGRIIHASGHHGAVVIEAFAEADARCRAEGLAPPIFRRV